MGKSRLRVPHLRLSPIELGAIFVIAVIPLIPPFNQEYLIRWLSFGALMAAQTVCFTFTAGYINVVNFGFAAFFGLGAYASALGTIHLGISPWLGMFLGMAAAALLGFLTGLLTLQLRGIFAAVMAWFIGLAIMGFATKLVFLTRGPAGLRCPPLFESAANLPYFYVIFAMLLVTYVTLSAVTRSHLGLAFKAIGQSLEAARTSGISPAYYRIINFTLSCGFAGWLGGFYAHYYGILTPDMMHTSKTVEVLAIAYIGGRGSLWGGALTAFPFIYAMETLRSWLSQLPGLNLIIYGVFLIAIMIFYPGGVAELCERWAARIRGRREQQRSVVNSAEEEASQRKDPKAPGKVEGRQAL